jgi:hypothetical protein
VCTTVAFSQLPKNLNIMGLSHVCPNNSGSALIELGSAPFTALSGFSHISGIPALRFTLKTTR